MNAYFFSYVVGLVISGHLMITGLALRIDITPSTIVAENAGNVENASIFCSLDKQEADVDRVLLLKIEKSGYPPIVSVGQQRIQFYDRWNDSSKFQANGIIVNSDIWNSYLKLTILNISETDHGIYECKLYYSNRLYELDERHASAKLTVTKTTVDFVGKLQQQMVLMEKNFQAQISKVYENVIQLTTKVTQLQNEVQIQNEKLSRLESKEGAYCLFQDIVSASDEHFLYYTPGREVKLNYTEARDHCCSLGAYLVNIDSAEELHTLKSFIDSEIPTNASTPLPFVWVGAFKKQGEWVSQKDGTPLDFTKWVWSLNEPNNRGGKEDCGSVYEVTGRFNDLTCSYLTQFVCEKTPN